MALSKHEYIGTCAFEHREFKWVTRGQEGAFRCILDPTKGSVDMPAKSILG
jgi:hypothetical protein